LQGLFQNLFRETNLLNTSLVFVGTYTQTEGSQSEGIYVYRMDPASGKLTFERVVKDILNPSFLEIHPAGGFLYAVNEVQGYGGQAGGGLSAFSVKSDHVNLMNDQSSHGSDPCYVSVEQTGRVALVAK
jgi:6-phosphogluconolactonase